MYFRMIVLIGSIMLFGSLIGGAYFYYKNSQKQISELTEQVHLYESAIEEQKQTIYMIQDSLDQQEKIHHEMQSEMSSTKRQVEKIQNTIAKHNLTAIASKKASLLEKKINRASIDIIRCFELATGSAVTTNEKNNQCPDLIANP